MLSNGRLSTRSGPVRAGGVPPHIPLERLYTRHRGKRKTLHRSRNTLIKAPVQSPSHLHADPFFFSVSSSRVLPTCSSHYLPYFQSPRWRLGLLSSAVAVIIFPASRNIQLLMPTVSGLSAAHTIYLNGGNVLLLDKNSTHTAELSLHITRLIIQSRLLRWQLHQSNVRYQCRLDQDTGRRGHQRQRQAVLRRYHQIR